ncbi:HAD family hydrolase [Thiorhodospira sibirica]|uniref:HAD family hydrolase n=1 Tax=Thiorhodospira sibirica TaxID=154347 RepID=UPI00022C051A|nr:HAD-IA family hydrolase [Thiorhodospira sibirica]
MSAFNLQAVFFDLDGTLIDTAPDMYAALHTLGLEEQVEIPPFSTVRGYVSHGTSALIRLGFPDVDAPRFEHLRQRFLQIYAENLHLNTELFPGMMAVLAYLEHQGMPWGIVTNKPANLTDPLVRSLGLDTRAVSVVSGDTTDQRKPHPKPLLLACEQAGIAPAQCLYIGDASRDIEAGLAAGMQTLIALYGYIDNTQQPDAWGAHGVIHEPRDIVPWLQSYS